MGTHTHTHTKKNKTKQCIMGMFREENRLINFVLRIIGFIQTFCYDSMVNKTNFRNIREQNVHSFMFDFPEYYDLYLQQSKIRNTLDTCLDVKGEI